MIEIWHNPKCSKSRAAVSLLQEHGETPDVRLYLESPPDTMAIDRVLRLLDLEPRELMRRSEAPYRELGLDDPAKTRQELIAAMAAHPILIERPVVIRGDRAALGRPPENVLALLDEE